MWLAVSGGALLLIAIVVILCLPTASAWEKQNKARILQEIRSAKEISSSDKAGAWDKFNNVVKEAEGHKIKDRELRKAISQARAERDALEKVWGKEIEKVRKAREAAEQQRREQQERERLARQEREEAAKRAEEKRQQEAAEKERLARQDREEAAKRAEEKRQQVAAEMERKTSYLEYRAKTQAFYDSLFRTNSDLEVGINFQDFGDRIRDMNFQYNKWVASLSPAELRYPSARLMEVALNAYIASRNYWQAKFGEKRGAYWYADTMRQFKWRVASASLEWIKDCFDNYDVMPEQECVSCKGKGTVTCHWCSGSSKCPLRLHEYGICCMDGKCGACDAKGSFTCPICGGSGRMFTTK